MTSPPPTVLFWIYLLIIYSTFFLFSFSHSAHVDVHVCLSTTCVRISSVMEFVSPMLCWIPHFPTLRTTSISPIDWHRITENLSPPPTLPCINSILGELALFLDFWPLKMGPIGCPETSVINYHYSLFNKPEERSSEPCSNAWMKLNSFILF